MAEVLNPLKNSAEKTISEWRIGKILYSYILPKEEGCLSEMMRNERHVDQWNTSEYSSIRRPSSDLDSAKR